MIWVGNICPDCFPFPWSTGSQAPAWEPAGRQRWTEAAWASCPWFSRAESPCHDRPQRGLSH